MDLLYANDTRGSYPSSWYAATADHLPEFPSLRGEARADLCVIGGGYTGLSAALHAAQAGLSVVLLDAHRVGFGASGRNGGQVGTGFNKTQSELEKTLGREDARKLWEMAEAAKDLVHELAPEEAGYKPGVIHADWHDSEVADTHAEADFMAEHYDYRVEKLDGEALREIVRAPDYKGGTLDPGAGHLHPLRYAFGLARSAQAAGVQIYETSRVHQITHGPKARVASDTGFVLADHVVIATNGYSAGLDRKLSSRVMPINNFIVATEPLGSHAEVLSRDVAVADSKFVINYFRLSEDKRLLFGGGESYGYKFPRDIAAVVRKPMEQVFPQLKGVKIDYAWGGTLAITMTRLPHIGRPAANILSAAGFSGHGVALAGFTGKLMADAVIGDGKSLDLFGKLPTPPFPGGGLFRSPLLTLAMTWYAMRDRLGV